MLKFEPMSAPRRTAPTALQLTRTHFGVWLLALCLVGTQMLGLLHSVAHAGINPIDSATAAKVVYTTEHNCVLFDALALSSCAGPSTPPALFAAAPVYFFLTRHIALVFSADPLAFQSRAPPASLS